MKLIISNYLSLFNREGDRFLESCNLNRDWPSGRGIFHNDAKTFLVWVNEEDQLRIISMQKGADIKAVFKRLSIAATEIEHVAKFGPKKHVAKFAHDDHLGYITSCPTNLGTGMRASVHVKVPNLTKDGTDKRAKEVAGPLGLSVRGTGGEHTPIGADGTVDISPRARLFIKECEIVEALYKGVELLMKAEAEAGAE